MDLTSEIERETLVVTVNETRIDASVAIQFKDRMRAETNNEFPRIVLNLGKVEFIDSSGLGAIVAAMKQLGADRKLELSELQENVDRVFKLTRMDTIFRIHAKPEDVFAN